MNCPKCNLISPDTAQRCDCGWYFGPGVMSSYLSSEEMRQGELATPSERFIGQILDTLVAFLALLSGVLPVFLSSSLGSITALGGLGLALLYILFADGLAEGQSYGKRFTGAAVVDASTGAPCTFLQSFSRNLLLSFLGIFDWVFIFGQKRQRLGDMVANTIVIKK